MAATDYRCKNKEEIAKIPLIAHKIIVAKHIRRERWLTVALAFSVLIGIINLVLHKGVKNNVWKTS